MTKSFEEVQKEIAEIAKQPGKTITERSNPMSNLKKPVDLDLYYELNKRFGFWGIQMAGDDAGYFVCHIPQYMHQQIVMPDGPVATLGRAIDSRLNDLTFKKKDGTQTGKLSDFLVGPARKQAMLMAHKGKQSLLVNGTLVVADGKLILDAAPGQPIRRPVKKQ